MSEQLEEIKAELPEKKESDDSAADEALEMEILKMEHNVAVTAETLNNLRKQRPELASAIEVAVGTLQEARTLIRFIATNENLRPGSRRRVLEAIQEEAEKAALEVLGDAGSA